MGINQGPISLDQKYTQASGHVFLTGIQALVRLPMAQIRRDRAAGLKTAGFVTGYRGSPLGGYDQQLIAARKHLEQYDIKFQPGVNEDLAATAIWGSQQLNLSPGSAYDGVVGIWYGKGPGVDRCGDVFRHANAAGSAKNGGVLCLAGDDHGAKSSTVPHQSDHAFISALMPYLYPSSIHEMIEMGLLGIAMSRYSGCWVGMKVITETVETTAEIDLTDEMKPFVTPADFEMPPGGLNLRWPDDRYAQDRRLQDYKGFAAIAFARANRVNRITMDSPNARYGIMASGKSYEDVRQALRELGITPEVAAKIGLRLYKVGMPWPLEPQGVREFAVGLEEILIVEERREIIENQVKQELFNWRDDVRPRIVGKMDNHDKRFLPFAEELSVAGIATSLTERLLQLDLNPEIVAMLRAKADWFNGRQASQMQAVPPVSRTPYFCSGCPHNTSTKVPEGSRAFAGIGCHFMSIWMNRNTETFTHMGGEGVPWTGIAPFTKEKHVFANLGDGTYFHSGSLAIRQAVASKANITYKILYNDAVAMTGGQKHDGELSPQQITFQLHSEGIREIWLVSENPDAYPASTIAPGTKLAHRDELDQVMKTVREVPGCSAIVFVQTCAAEKRRRRKRGLMEDPAKRIFINAAVCEGCGDCSVQSNCISVEPAGDRARAQAHHQQSSCNKVFSCVKGFCPSFVTIEGGALRKRAPVDLGNIGDLPPPPTMASLDRPYNIAVGGVGGTGVLTIGALLGMAAHIEGKASMILDMSGLAQKGGAVLSHVRLSKNTADVTCSRNRHRHRGPRDRRGRGGRHRQGDDLAVRIVTHPWRHQHPPHSDRGLHPEPRFRFQARQGQPGAGDRAAEGLDLPRLHPSGREPAGRFDRHQHDDAGLRLPEGSAAGRRRGHRAGDRTERRLDQDEYAGVPSRPACGGRSGAARRDDEGRERAHEDAGPDVAGRDHRASHRAADRLSERGLCRALSQPRRPGPQDRARRRLRRGAAAGGGGELCQAARLQGRVRSRAALRRPAVRGERREQFEGDFTMSFNLAPPILAGKKDASGPPAQASVRSVDDAGVTGVHASLRVLRGTPFDLFGYGEERRMERNLYCRLRAGCRHGDELLSPKTVRYRGRAAVAAGSNPRLRPGQGGLGRQGQGAI